MKTGWVLLYGVICGLLVGGIIFLASRPERGDAVLLKPAPTNAPILVYVSGQVSQAGVYSLAPGSRVQDAVLLAGGLTDQADPVAINLAARLVDGQKVYIPSLGETPPEAASRAAPGILININTATQAELETLPGVGPATAQAIIQYRSEHGSFQGIDELDEVPGIGKATVETLRDLVTVAP